MDRSFPAFLSRNNGDGASIRSAQVLKQEAEDIGYEGQEILEYVKQQQADAGTDAGTGRHRVGKDPSRSRGENKVSSLSQYQCHS